MSYQTARHTIINCHNVPAAKYDLRDNKCHVLHYREVVITPTGLQKVTK